MARSAKRKTKDTKPWRYAPRAQRHALTDLQDLDGQGRVAASRQTMTTYSDNRIWQDVYHARRDDLRLYVKFMKDHDGYLVVSFKEMEI